MRWQRLRSKSERDALETGSGPRAVAAWPVLADYMLEAVWSLFEAVTLGGDPPAIGRAVDGLHTDADRLLSQVSRLDLRTLRVQTVPLLAEPLCPSCPLPDGADPVLVLASRPKATEHTYRLRQAASYPLPTGALANPVCGALGAGTWMNVTSPTTAPVAGTVFVRGYAGLCDVTWSGQANSFASSRDLAFLEGLERYAGTHRRRRRAPVIDSYENLGADALDPADCGFYAAETYRRDPMLQPFSARRKIPWVRGYSLRDDRPILVPARLCFYSAGSRADNFVFECSNGCAIGSCLEEALLFGLLELIERDAFMLAWYGGARLTELDLESCRNPAVRAMVDRATLQGYDVHAFDNRVDLAVPVVTGLAVRNDGGLGTLAFAAGAGFDPEAAVEMALSEVLTYIPHLPRQVGERRAELEAMVEDYDQVRQLTDHAQLYGLPQMAVHAQGYLEPAAVRPIDDVYRDWLGRPQPGKDLLDDVRLCRDELVRAGHDVIAVDQTTPEQERMGLRTVCAIVPGLLPIDFGWARQRALRMPRLRSAFRVAGWRATDLADDEIRHVPHPFP
jgi:ribosomal protein S12 methylthiotransferase accessory factor